MIASFGVGQVLWSLIWLFIVVSMIMLQIRCIGDVFRTVGMSGVAKALWTLFILFAPFLGSLSYLIVHGEAMAGREVKAIEAQQEAVRQYVRDAAGTSGSAADELNRLADLRDRGVIDADEFAKLKARVLG